MKTWGWFTICIVLLAWASVAMGATLHVDASGGGDYTSIQAALDAAVTGHDKIEVSPGTYYETIDFHGKAVQLYSKHGPAETIIDGTGNYHVVRCTSGEGPDTLLEGFTITGGNANGAAMEDTWGGGMYNSGASPTVANCVFAGNTADRGGGMFNTGASPSLTNCVFHDNSGDRGGAMYNEAGSPAVNHCTFQDNSATRGGGMFNEIGSEAIVTCCAFHDNHADEDGGAICNGLIGRATVTDCAFTNNDAGLGGAIASIQGSGDATGCTFVDNAAHEGGAIYYGDSAGAVTNCTFRHNLAGGGGAISNGASDVLVTNCVFTANGVTGQGGAILNVWSDLTATHCTFTGNTADISAGGIMSMGVGYTTTVTNCILWADTGGELDSGFATLAVTYSDIDGGWEGEGNIDADPRFAGAAGDFHLAANSPCIDAGTNDPPGGLPATDIEGNPRPVDGNGDGAATADMGAYESPAKVRKAKRP